MIEIMTQIINYMRITSLTFDMFGKTWSFTFMEITVGVMIIDLGIYIVERILNND